MTNRPPTRLSSSREVAEKEGAHALPPPPWGDWIFDEYLGAGGMARVYRGHFGRKVDDESPLAHPIAIKVPLDGTQFFEELCGMLSREGACMQRLSHPNVVRAYRYGSLLCGWPYIAMELVEGGTLRDCMTESGGALDEGNARLLILQIAKALQYTNDAGIIHCDLKPENILMQGMHVRLADFGIAVTVNEGYGFDWGSYHYLSPEHLQGARLTPLSDVYMLGCLLHEMLTGEVPFEGEEAEVTERKTTQDGPSIRERFQGGARGNVSPEMDSLVRAMLKRRPEERPPDVTRLITSYFGELN